MNTTRIQSETSRRFVQVVVSIQFKGDAQHLSIDPWDNCPSQLAREEGRFCNDCEFWGREVQGIDWAEFSLCMFDDK